MRRSDLIVRAAADELLVYDLVSARPCDLSRRRWGSLYL
jgi:hypothetical protein